MSTPSHPRFRVVVGLSLLAVVAAGILLHTHQHSRCFTCEATERLFLTLASVTTASCPLIPLGWTPEPPDSTAGSTIAFQPVLSRAPPA